MACAIESFSPVCPSLDYQLSLRRFAWVLLMTSVLCRRFVRRLRARLLSGGQLFQLLRRRFVPSSQSLLRLRLCRH
jgi:hypothetical protein